MGGDDRVNNFGKVVGVFSFLEDIHKPNEKSSTGKLYINYSRPLHEVSLCYDYNVVDPEIL